MVAHCKPVTTLTVAFWRNHECFEARIACDGSEACEAAIKLLTTFAWLQHGDYLLVTAGDTAIEDTLPEPSRASHYS